MISEAIHDALASLWRRKLRTALTMGGVTVAIATLVALLSFAAGMRRSITDQLERFNLEMTLTVTPSSDDSSAVLDSAAIAWMQTVDGVRQVFPQRPFPVTAYLNGDTLHSEAQALFPGGEQSVLLRDLLAGERISPSDSTRALITLGLLDWPDDFDADSLVGDTLILQTTRSSSDSGFARVRHELMFGDIVQPADITAAFSGRTGDRDSLISAALGAAASAFIDGYTNHAQLLRDTLVIAGVADANPGWGNRLRPVILPEAVARRMEPVGIGSDPFALIEGVQSGDLFLPAPDTGEDQYPRITVELTDPKDHAAVADTLRAHGYQVEVFQEFLVEFRRGFLIFSAGLTLLGSIALFVAALGIVNTMVTSILERRREIGVMKALGAEDRDIHFLFLIESGVIGVLGSVFGILLGWGAAELGAVILLRVIDESSGDMDLVHLSWEVVGIALLFGLAVSVIAGLYPASRAARLDPVKALRED